LSVSSGDLIGDLREFIDERWAVVQRQPRFRDATEGWVLTPRGVVPPLAEAITPGEAASFLASVAASGSEPPLFVVQDNNKVRSDRCPAVGKGRPRGYVFFENSGRSMGGLRLETIVHMAAIARLRDEFGWPREHLVCESPSLVEDAREVLRYDALDILLLEEPCAELEGTMTVTAARSRVAIEAKATAKMLDKLLQGMRACQTHGASHGRSDHVKCSAIAVIRPRLFVGVTAGTWRLFTVVERDGQAVLGDELANLDHLYREPPEDPDGRRLPRRARAVPRTSPRHPPRRATHRRR
jgi:hypothetical protein